MKKIIVTVPAYNEEEKIEQALEEGIESMVEELVTRMHYAAGYAGKENYKPLHCTTPWAFSGDISLMILPAFYHSNISQIADVFPGIVDYSEKFNAINFILSVKKEGHSLIKAGTPLLHIIPIIKNNYTCNIDTPANLKNNRTLNVIPGNFKQYYRKLFMRKSKFKVNLNDY